MEIEIEKENINKKIKLLKSFLKKAELNKEYAFSILGDNYFLEIQRIRGVVASCKIAFGGWTDGLDERATKKVTKNWNRILDEELAKFPEFNMGEVTEPKEKGSM